MVNGIPLDLSPSELVWYATLALARRAGSDEEGWIPPDSPHLRHVIGLLKDRKWRNRVNNAAIKALLDAGPRGKVILKAADLAKLRADTRARLGKWCKAHLPQHAALLVPEVRKRHVKGTAVTQQRLPLAQGQVVVVEE